MADRVVCCDGTWNTPDDVDDGLPAATNVHKIYSALADRDSRKSYYHPGVGTGGGWWTRVAGGAAGVGLTKNVKSAYRGSPTPMNPAIGSGCSASAGAPSPCGRSAG